MGDLTGKDIEFLFPVQAVILHPNGHLTIERRARYKPPESSIGNKTKITKLSTKSLRRFNHIMQTTLIQFNSIITLTYGKYFPQTGRQVKDDLHYILRTIKLHSDNYVWFLEFQKRGAPHLHILSECASITPRMRVKLASNWITRILQQEYFWAECPVGSVNDETIKMLSVAAHWKSWETIRDPDGARKYIAKYATKPYQKIVPEPFGDVGRFWGASKEVKEVLGVRVECTLQELRELLVKHGHKAKDWDMLPKNLWGVANDATHNNGY